MVKRNGLYDAIFTNKLKDAATACAALGLFSEDTGVCDFAACDECVQELRGRSAKHLLQKLQRRRHHIMIPVLRVVQGQFIDLRTQENALHVHKYTVTYNESLQHT